MNLAEIRERIQIEFGDLNQAQVVNASLLRWINSGILDVVRRTGCLSTTSNIAFTVGLVTASLPSTFLKFLNAGYTSGGAYTHLTYSEYQSLVSQVGVPNDLSPQGRPLKVYVRPELNTIGTWPLPDGSYTVVLEHSKRPAALSVDADIPEIPLQYHDLIVLYTLIRCAKSDDDLQRSQSYELEYQEAISLSLSDASNPVANEYAQIRSVEDLTYAHGWNSW